VLAHARRQGDFDAVWSLGDIVGYGPQPKQCMALLRSLPNVVAIAGNHDLAAAGALGIDNFNSLAAQAALWTWQQLSEEERDWLEGLPKSQTEGDFTLVHGSLLDPIWEYLVETREATQHLSQQITPYCFVGHSHLPLLYYEAPGRAVGRALCDGDAVALESDRLFANPGSVGQPRDGDPRAAYALLDTDARLVSFHRVPYDVSVTQDLMLRAGLPEALAERLAHGR
jgi:diadenosine tetraphosphatase ApaH/serine/threonine PP2A family protein phosphatase